MRFQPIQCYSEHLPERSFIACIIDTETTGLDTQNCEIIELGYQLIEFDSQGNFYQVKLAKNFLNEPEGGISDEVTKVTGLTLEEVKGHQIPWQEVQKDIENVDLIVAHNASFDRFILERYHPIFVDKIWGCSASQIDWFNLTNVSSRSQEFLCWKVGQFFYHTHRALDDVQALTHLLAQPITEQQLPAFHFLLQSVRQTKIMIKATGAPFDIKDNLKNRGYRWNNNERVWQKILPENEKDQELTWLIEHSTPNPQVIKLKATDTFSIRAQ